MSGITFPKLDDRWLPKSILCLRDYSSDKFLRDLIAGITVGLVALPLAMAFSIASGLSPQAGIYCAIVTGFLISLLGGSKTQIGGPTGAFVVVIAGIIAVHGVDGLFMCTVMAGVMLVVLGLTGMGSAVKFIPRPIVIGFTNGIAVLIASTQIKDFFGLHVDKVPGEFLHRMETLAANFGTLNYEAALLAIATVAILIGCRMISNRVPGAIVALLLGTAAVAIFKLPVETVGTRFGGIPSGLPHFAIPQFRADLILRLLSPALTVAMLGAIESLMSAVVSDRMSNDRHNPNVELFGQGIANIVSPLFGGLPATGAIARTATNIRSGAQTPVAGMIHSLTLLCVVLFAAPLVKFVPMAVLAGILMVVAYNMGEWREIGEWRNAAGRLRSACRQPGNLKIATAGACPQERDDRARHAIGNHATANRIATVRQWPMTLLARSIQSAKLAARVSSGEFTWDFVHVEEYEEVLIWVLGDQAAMPLVNPITMGRGMNFTAEPMPVKIGHDVTPAMTVHEWEGHRRRARR